jgi:large subunit ribosomal protein L32
MAVPKRKHTHSRAAKRRTHYKVTLKKPVKCKACGSFKMPHMACPSCGEY